MTAFRVKNRGAYPEAWICLNSRRRVFSPHRPQTPSPPPPPPQWRRPPPPPLSMRAVFLLWTIPSNLHSLHRRLHPCGGRMISMLNVILSTIILPPHRLQV